MLACGNSREQDAPTTIICATLGCTQASGDTKSAYYTPVLSKQRKLALRRCMQRLYNMGYDGLFSTGFGIRFYPSPNAEHEHSAIAPFASTDHARQTE